LEGDGGISMSRLAPASASGGRARALRFDPAEVRRRLEARRGWKICTAVAPATGNSKSASHNAAAAARRAVGVRAAGALTPTV
jgi:hypothetical protein